MVSQKQDEECFAKKERGGKEQSTEAKGSGMPSLSNQNPQGFPSFF